ncbi:uncharacterized protein LOC134601891 [Pelobates fuscus]|uniref:uncharacterized protein LOC134601891 n=1 Tax=Pelobates fuscus TaxID=191477 RepID=UPI002FE4AE8E
MGPFIILLLLQQDIVQSSAQYYCALQDRTMRVTEGGSVTSRCKLSYPERDDYTALLIQWYDSEYGNCYTGYNIDNLTMISTHDKYKGRISIMTNSVEIREVNRKDGPVICCSVNVTYTSNVPFYFSTLYGTRLLFDDQVWVDQLEAVTALTGDNITISCHINYPAGRNISVQQVIWKMGEDCHIADNISVIFSSEVRESTERFSVVDFPNDVSLRINNIQMNDGRTYCCLVKTNEGEFSIKHGTELVITGLRRHSEFTVNQPEESSAPVGGSANITCSYNTLPAINKTLMDAVIYWRAGSLDGPIAYHPSTWMVHPTYRGRTNVTQQADLQIMGVQDTDSSVYYCFVTLKFCVGNGVINNSISYGNGTRLIITEEKTSPTQLVTSTKSGPPMHTTSLKGVHKISRTLIIVISSVIFLAILIVVGGIQIFRKGLCCKKEHRISVIQQNVVTANAGDLPNERTRGGMENEQEEAGFFYADLNLTKVNPGRSHYQPDHEAVIIYSAVKS